MFAVIFKAEILNLEDEYISMAQRLRDLALNQYDCLEFISSTAGKTEIAISYWESQDQIKKWKENSEHLYAQREGARKWYKSYTVEVVEIIRTYQST